MKNKKRLFVLIWKELGGVVDTDLRFEFGIDELPQTGLKIKSIDSAAGIVYFENDTGLQIEVCRFTRHNKGPHEGTEIYSDRIGKRYKPWNLIPYGATEWAVPDIHRQGKRIYLKFCTFNPETKQRSELTKVTVVVASLRDMYNTGNTKIFLDDFN